MQVMDSRFRVAVSGKSLGYQWQHGKHRAMQNPQQQRDVSPAEVTPATSTVSCSNWFARTRFSNRAATNTMQYRQRHTLSILALPRNEVALLHSFRVAKIHTSTKDFRWCEGRASLICTTHTVEHDPFIKSQRFSQNCF